MKNQLLIPGILTNHQFLAKHIAVDNQQIVAVRTQPPRNCSKND